MLYVNFKSTYDSIVREELYEAMISFGLPKHLVRLVRLTMSYIECQVKIEEQTSKTFHAGVG